MNDQFDDEGESLAEASTVECPNCGEFIYDDAEQCPFCLEYVTWNRSVKLPTYVKIVVWVLIAALVLPAVFALIQLL